MITSYYAQECITNQQKQLVEIQQPAKTQSSLLDNGKGRRGGDVLCSNCTHLVVGLGKNRIICYRFAELLP
jgi:hypothetical protein